MEIKKILLGILLFWIGCISLYTTDSGRIQGELIVCLEDYVQNEQLDDFVSEFSQYEFYLRENLFPQMSICFFSFNHELIDGDDKNGGQYVK